VSNIDVDVNIKFMLRLSLCLNNKLGLIIDKSAVLLNEYQSVHSLGVP